MPNFAVDSFTRANQSGWGTGTDGNTYAQVVGTDTLSISSNQGLITCVGAGSSDRILYGSTSLSASEALIRATISNVTSFHGLLLCSDSTAANHYAARLNAGTHLLLEKRVAGSNSALATLTFSYSVSNAYWLRFRVKNGVLYGKAWLDGSAEPAAWTGSVADATFSSGRYGIACFPATGITEKFDTFSVNDTHIAINDGCGGMFS